MATVFSMKAVTLTWIATAYLISTVVFQIPFAHLADMVGIAVFSLCTFLCGRAPSGGILIVLRFLSGVGSAMALRNQAILTSVFPPEQRGKARGINTAVVYAALAAGPFLGGMLTHYPGRQSLFFVTASVGVPVLVFARLFSFSILATLINCSATSAIAFMLSLYLQYVRGLDASHAGLFPDFRPALGSCVAVTTGYCRYDPYRLRFGWSYLPE